MPQFAVQMREFAMLMVVVMLVMQADAVLTLVVEQIKVAVNTVQVFV